MDAGRRGGLIRWLYEVVRMRPVTRDDVSITRVIAKT